jgi:hypothetical protein
LREKIVQREVRKEKRRIKKKRIFQRVDGMRDVQSKRKKKGIQGLRTLN